MKRKNENKTYGEMQKRKVCDYCKVVVTDSEISECKYALIMFYDRKPFNSFYIGSITEYNLVDKIAFWLKYYTELNMKGRKSCKSLARYYWKKAKSKVCKLSPNGEIIKDYTGV